MTLPTSSKFHFFYISLYSFISQIFPYVWKYFPMTKCISIAAREIKFMGINFTKLHLAPAAQVPGPVGKGSSLSPHQASCACLSTAAKVGKIIYFLLRLLLCKAPTSEFCLTVDCGLAHDEATPQSSAQIQVSSSPEFLWMMKGE